MQEYCIESVAGKTMPELDRTDVRILATVQEHGDLTLEELAARVSLSPSQCSRRLQNLRTAGYISRIVALLDPSRLGLGLKAYVLITLRQQGKRSDAFHEFVRQSEEILECSMVAGEADYILKLWTRDLKSFRVFLDAITATKQVHKVRSSIVVEESKSTTAFPMQMLARKGAPA
jgi:Lrp/AsnC family leucine-responsive transcriptional regulator